MIFCGIDVGTQGARCVMVTGQGEVVGESACPFQKLAAEGLPEGWFEQEPEHWLTAVRSVVHGALTMLEKVGQSPRAVRAISVTSTSGTLCALDDDGRPVAPVIMYSDSRSTDEAAAVQAAGAAVASSLGYRFGTSFALPKILWLKNHWPDLFAAANVFVSPTDFIIGYLTKSWRRTDQTNALKYGYDLIEQRWPEFIEKELEIPRQTLPNVQMTGQRAGDLAADSATELGLPIGTPVAAGLTDGCASQISSGAVAPGDFNTTIGTTLVIKGVTQKLLLDPQGRIYCHKHPEGWWLPGGASNTGAECLEAEFEPADRDRLSATALEYSPTSLVSYPLVGRGERFPFQNADAQAFLLGEPKRPEERFTAHLEGVACLERLAFETMEELGAEVGERIYSAGGGARSDAWLQIRADMLGRTVLRPMVTGGAMGAAIVAAAMTEFKGLTDAARQMVKIERETPPRADMTAAYDEKYGKFREECRRRGYIR